MPPEMTEGPVTRVQEAVGRLRPPLDEEDEDSEEDSDDGDTDEDEERVSVAGTGSLCSAGRGPCLLLTALLSSEGCASGTP